MTNLRRNGQPSSHTIRFHDFLKEDPRYLVFLMAFNDSHLHGDIKSNPRAELCWQMPTTREIFNLTGRFYIIASPLKITRFPAPKVDDSSTVPALQYWESQRCAVWTSLTSQTRASFSWPPSGEALQPDQERAMKMDVMLGSSAKADTKEQIVHNVALDNFCLLAFKVGGMTRFEYGQFPPKRMVFTLDEKTQEWHIAETNP
ncbi:4098_t:CDS:2 [Paraglomus brasilianum]|uniref:4098_t:CDS:1 n=1 Tax=Paraglomus brasilianum TaxID=144538 RepID=A0A9N9GCL1_9GLOM|nr:4098_t:CDS:2 [Paraglomus brasilianum]